MVDELKERLKEQDLDLDLTDAAKEKITEEGYDPEYGARPLRRAIQKFVEDRLSEELLKGTITPGEHIVFDVEDDEFVIKTKKSMQTVQ